MSCRIRQCHVVSQMTTCHDTHTNIWHMSYIVIHHVTIKKNIRDRKLSLVLHITSQRSSFSNILYNYCLKPWDIVKFAKSLCSTWEYWKWFLLKPWRYTASDYEIFEISNMQVYIEIYRTFQLPSNWYIDGLIWLIDNHNVM